MAFLMIMNKISPSLTITVQSYDVTCSSSASEPVNRQWLVDPLLEELAESEMAEGEWGGVILFLPSFSSLKVAQNSFQNFPRRRF